MTNCANSSALRQHEQGEANSQLIRERAEGGAFRELTTSVSSFLEAFYDAGDTASDADRTEEHIRDLQLRMHYSPVGAIDKRLARAVRSKAAVKAMQSLLVDKNYSREMTEREAAIAAFLEDVTASWMQDEIDRRATEDEEGDDLRAAA